MSSPIRSPRGSNIMLIKDLNMSSRAWIQGKLSEVVTRDYKSGNGKLLTGRISDESGSIKVVVFTNDIYRFEKNFFDGSWVRINGYSFEDGNFGKQIKLSRISSLFCTQSFDIPAPTLDLVKFDEIYTKKIGDVIDAIGVIFEVDELKSFVSKAGKAIMKRSILLIDQSESKIEVILWNEEAETFAGTRGQSFCIKGGKLNEFNNQLTINVPRNGYTLNSDIEKSEQLIEWFKNQSF